MSNYFDSAAGTWDLNPMKVRRAQATAEMVRATPLHSRKHLIDFGGGTGLLSICLQDDFAALTIVDSSTAMRGEAERKLSEAQIRNISTARTLSEAAACSAMVSLMVLHHVQDLADFFNNARRSIERGGVLMIADLFEEDGSFHLHDPDFQGHNGFNIDRLTATMLDYGFRVSRVTEYFNVPKTGRDGLEREYPLFFLAADRV